MSIQSYLEKYIGHKHYCITSRGDTAIEAALKNLEKEATLLIPQEGGWLSYPKLAKKLHLKAVQIPCQDALIDLNALELLLKEHKPTAILYHQPGAYTIAQPSKEIYQLCKTHNCLVIMDICGSIGTHLCNSEDADICVSSFRKWKLVQAFVGGVISTNSKDLLKHAQELTNKEDLQKIEHALKILPERLDYLFSVKNKIQEDLGDLTLLGKDQPTTGVIIPFEKEEQKERIINYCKENNLEWTVCPRDIRIKGNAISIEVKRL